MGKWLAYYRSGEWKAHLAEQRLETKGQGDSTLQSRSYAYSRSIVEICTEDGWVLEARPYHPGGWVWVQKGGW